VYWTPFIQQLLQNNMLHSAAVAMCSMTKPAFIFDGRNILDHAKLREMGFVVYALGKPLDPFLRKD
jgi:hypothetical protein